MTCSHARLAANRANAALSTGPRSAEGEEASRANALEHGLAAGVVVPPCEDAEVGRREEVLGRELRPSGELGRILVRRVAVLSARLDRCVRHEAACVAKHARDAQARYDDERMATIEKMGDWIAAEPATHVRRLKETPEGIDWLIGAWLAVKSDLLHPTREAWNYGHRQRVDNLMGRTPEQIPWSPLAPLCKAGWGDFSELADDEGAGRSDTERKAWAREELGRRIDAEVVALRALKPELDVERLEQDRAEAAERALFDSSREAVLARKYEASTERGMFRALREFREVEAEAAAMMEVASGEFEALGSFGPVIAENSGGRAKALRPPSWTRPRPVSPSTPPPAPPARARPTTRRAE